jgi:hypothetical protein
MRLQVPVQRIRYADANLPLSLPLQTREVWPLIPARIAWELKKAFLGTTVDFTIMGAIRPKTS